MDYQSLGTIMMWISPDGEIMTDKGSHIEYVISNPAKFGLSREYIERTYAKYSEPLKTEGNARKELITELVNKGWIRLRRYPNQYWSINVFRLNDEVRTRLRRWAVAVLNGISGFKEIDREMPVRITCFENNTLLQTTMENLTGKLQQLKTPRNTFLPVFSLVRDYNFPLHHFFPISPASQNL